MTQKKTNSALGLFPSVLSSLGRLAQKIQQAQPCERELDELQMLLETLPLTSDEFGVACDRLRNAQRFLQKGEGGAARWELNALRSALDVRRRDGIPRGDD